jgi:hypothetical protein
MMMTLNNYISKLIEILEEDVSKEEDNMQWIRLKSKAKINNNKLFRININNKHRQ